MNSSPDRDLKHTNQQEIKLNKKDLSPKIQAILEKFKHDKVAYSTLKDGYLRLATHKILQDSIKHQTFCDYFTIPKKLSGLLLKLYDVSENELRHEMQQFHLKDHQVYTDSYYLTLLLAYLIGLDNNDEELRQYALALIAIKIWNYYKLTYFPKVCNPEIAQYVINHEIQANSTFKKFGSPFAYILKYSIPMLELKYPQVISKNPTQEYDGLKRIITTIRSRYNQLLKHISKAYYKAYSEGKREGSSAMYDKQHEDGVNVVEKNEHFSSIIERISDKIIKIATLKKKVLEKEPARSFLYKKFFISAGIIQKIDDFLDNEENHEDLQYFIELLLTGYRVKTEEEICRMDVDVIANKINSAKKEEYYLKAKELVSGIANSVFNDENANTNTKYRNRKILLTALLVYFKILNCKKI